ncbi:MAG: hypothetical protein Q7T51_04380 [Candidatus Moranbacteria bacterium]|nr:hypothetical protein [Candidatus Moranbacteria bacterium]
MKNSTGNKKILLSLTTTEGSNWREKIEEIKLYNLTEISLFLTNLAVEDRQELYKRLEETPLRSVPHVHLRGDMTLAEVDYLVERYDVKVFNIHSATSQYPLVDNFSKYAKRIYVENSIVVPTADELAFYGGFCLDVSHWEDYIFQCGSDYDVKKDVIMKILEKFPVGCAHISAVNHPKEDPHLPGNVICSDHWLKDLSEVNYIKKYLQYLPDIISIELENSFKEQLEVKKYLEGIINV